MESIESVHVHEYVMNMTKTVEMLDVHLLRDNNPMPRQIWLRK